MGMRAQISFSDVFIYFLKRPESKLSKLSFRLKRRTSVKDAIEALGVPHTEVGGIKINGMSAGFDSILDMDDQAEVLPFLPPVDVTQATLLRPDPYLMPRFIIDVNVAKLGALLRLMGLDSAYNSKWHDEKIAQISMEEQRIVLTRDRSLLKRKIVVYGRLIREQNPWAQLVEVLTFYDVHKWLLPFSRCSLCNEILCPVPKKEILDSLEPLTRIFYDEFTQCPSCGQIYWAGSHKHRIIKRIQNILEKTHRMGLQYDVNVGRLFNEDSNCN